MKKKSVHKNETEMEKCLYPKNGVEALMQNGEALYPKNGEVFVS